MKPKLIPRWVLIVAAMLAAVALMTGVAFARTGGGSLFSAAGNSPSETISQPEATMLRGGRYQLTDVTFRDIQVNASQESNVASGGGYHLQGLARPRLTGNGCCCIYLPCVIR